MFFFFMVKLLFCFAAAELQTALKCATGISGWLIRKWSFTYTMSKKLPKELGHQQII